jgi:hypothetical protein
MLFMLSHQSTHLVAAGRVAAYHHVGTHEARFDLAPRARFEALGRACGPWDPLASAGLNI